MSQTAALVTNPSYAAELRLTPSLAAPQLRATILFCGIYDMKVVLAKDDLPGSGGLMARLTRWGTDEAIWAYTGSRDHDTAALRQMSSIDHATAASPRRSSAVATTSHSPTLSPAPGGKAGAIRGRGDDALLSGRPRTGVGPRVPIRP